MNGETMNRRCLSFNVAFFIIGVIFLQVTLGCKQSVGLGRFTQDIQDGSISYPVKIADIRPDRYGRTTVGIQSAGTHVFDTRSGEPPIGAYIMGGGDEYQYDDYDLDDGVIYFQFDTDVSPDRVIVYPQSSREDISKHKAFDGKTGEAIRFFVPEQFAIDINTLIRQNRIRVEVIGRSVDRTAVSITNRYFTILPVKIGIGTWFDSFSDVTQDMAVTREICFVMEPHENYILTVPTACMNIHKSAPDRQDNFAVNNLKNYKEHKELTQVLKMLRRDNISADVTQYAVWIITDDLDEDIFNNLLTENMGSGLLDGLLRFFGLSAGESSGDEESVKNDINKAKRIIRQVKKPKGSIPFLP
jgi:hypothetical protein